MKSLPLIIGFGVAIFIFGGIIAYSRLLVIGTTIAVVFVASVLYKTYLAAPGCNSDDVTILVIKQISSQFSNQILDEQKIQTISRGFLSYRNECEMEVAPITGYDAGTAQKWTRITYSTSWSKPSGAINVEAHIIGP